MKAEKIITSPFEFIQITKCEIRKAVDEHGFALLQGYIPFEKEEEYLMAACKQTEVAIRAVGEEGEGRQIYCGILEDMKIIHENALCLMEIRVVPYTYLMDLNPARRSFQVPKMTYQEVLDCIMTKYQGGFALMNAGAGVMIGEPVVQYQETDWEFVRRLASHFHTVITPSHTTSGVKLYFGLAQREGAAKLFPSGCRIEKRIDEYLYKEQNQVKGLTGDDSLVYIVEDRELFEVGEQAEVNGRQLYVACVESRLDGHQLQNIYHLKTKGGFSVPRQYNERIIGASLDGRVTAVREDVVRVSLRTDAGKGAGKWFPFSTVYSSPDGSGWYCMPEPGDEIRLYFPTEREKHGYVISAVHLPVSEQDRGGYRCDPSCKTIRTSSGKTVELTGNSIRLDAGNGICIVLDDASGISIDSSKDISIKSDSVIDISSMSGKVEIMGSEGVNITQNDSGIGMSGGSVVYSNATAKVQ